MRKILTVIGKILLVIAGLTGLALVALRIFGVQFLAVRTGSMGTDYPVGSLMAVRNCKPEDIRTDDVITYCVEDETETYVTHRVIAVDTDKQCFVTQGDANNTADGNKVSFSNVVGKVLACIPRAGYPLLWLGASGKWIVAVALALFAFINILSAMRRPKEERDR